MDSILYQLKKYKFQFFRGMSNIMTEVVKLMIIDKKMHMNFTVLLQMQMCVSKAFLMKVSSDKLNLQIKKITTDYNEK